MSGVAAYHAFVCALFVVQGRMWTASSPHMEIEEPTSVKLKMRERKLRRGVGKGLRATRRKSNGRISRPWSIRIKQWQ